MTAQQESKTKGMCIATRCTSVEQFIQMFHRFVDDESFFVSTMNTRPPGLETSFSVQLADGTPVLRGLCVVMQAWTNNTSPFKTPGVRLGIKRLTANSMPVFERLLVTRTAMKPVATPPPLPSPRLAQGTVDPPRVPSAEHDAPTKATPPGSKADDDEPIIETRTPGSDLVLPANPLMHLTDESLEGYVDCTLYEETGNFFPADDDAVMPLDDVIDPPPLLAPRPVASRVSTPLPVELAMTASRPTPPPPPEPAPEPPSAATPVPAADRRVDLAPSQRRRPRYWIAGGFAVTALATVTIVVTTQGSSSSKPVPPTPSPPVVAKVERPATADAPSEQPAIADSPRPVEEPPTSGDGPPLVGDGPCRLAIQTTPAGSMVRLDGQTLAPSPITVATACGKHKVEISHARYQPSTKLVTVEEGSPTSLDVRLSRPTHSVMVTSTPPGATIFIDGRRAGTTPSKLDVLGFQAMKIELKKTGFQPTTAKLYSKVAQDKVNVRLAKW